MITLSAIGLGNRGFEYVRFVKYLHRKEAKTLAVCDTNPSVLRRAAKCLHLTEGQTFSSADAFFDGGVRSDGIIIATQDDSHYAVTKRALEVGYKYILLEKPVSKNYAECEELARLSHEKGAELIVCHVLRYAEYYRTLKEILRSGAIGDLIHINHTENVGYFHFAHSYVRGNWRREDETSPSLLAKCCHDIDLICWFADSPCTSVSSHGGLKYFRKENAPQGATQYCLDCPVKKGCPYDAEYTYVTAPPHKATFVKYLRRTVTDKAGATKRDVREAMRNTNYGKCVFFSDNDVCDHQTVALTFQSGVTCYHTMTAFTAKFRRTSHFIGTKGEILCTGKKMTVNVFGKSSRSFRPGLPFIPGHGEGDMRTIDGFLKLIQGKPKNKEDITSIDATLISHKIVELAEQSRKRNGSILPFDQ